MVTANAVIAKAIRTKCVFFYLLSSMSKSKCNHYYILQYKWTIVNWPISCTYCEGFRVCVFVVKSNAVRPLFLCVLHFIYWFAYLKWHLITFVLGSIRNSKHLLNMTDRLLFSHLYAKNVNWPILSNSCHIT